MKVTTKLWTVLFGLLLVGASAVAFADRPSRSAPAPAATPAVAAARADAARTLGFVPQFLMQLPDQVMPGAWEEMKALELNPGTKLTTRTKELVALAVAAQIPCPTCVYAHAELAKLNGASERELGEAVAMAAVTRHWSTFLSGIQVDEGAFRSELERIVSNMKAAAATPDAGRPIDVVDGETALAQITKVMGFVPGFLDRFPAAARAGAWRQMNDVQLGAGTALSGKNKELIGLGVAAQVPCRACVMAHTELAKLNGATDAELTEAIAMASLARTLGTLLAGSQLDEAQVRKDVDDIVANQLSKRAPRSQR